MQKPLLPTALLLALATSARAAAPPSPLSQLASQFRDYCLAPSTDHGERLLDDVELPKTSISQAAHLITTLQPDGSWPDIDYNSKARSAWPPYDHLTRVLALTVYARRPQTSPDESAKSIAAVHRSLAFWARRDFKCPNWWYNDIGNPKILGTIALLLDDNLTPAEFTYITTIVMPRSKVGTMTGQNRVWIAGNALMQGVLQNDPALVKKAAAVIHEEINVSTNDEGIQPDWSFHQHGPQLQFGNYGLAYAMDITRWAIILRNTPFALPEPKLEILRNYLLQGQNWITWRGTMDISSCGRQLFPNTPRSKAATIAAVMQTMSLVDTTRADDYLAFVKRNTVPDAPNDLLVVRYFWRSDYLLHRSPDLCISLKMHSNRVIGGETVNSENLSGNHLSDGATFFYRTGDEYTEIFPCWNWRMIPGTTSALDDSPLTWVKPKDKSKPAPAPPPKETETTPPPSTKTKSEKPVGTPFVGAVTDGSYAAAAMDFERGDLHAHKAWFFADGITLCLGAGITATSDAPIVTTINQCIAYPDIAIDNVAPSNLVITNKIARTITHDGLEYFFPDPTAIQLSAKSTTGNWKKVFDIPSTPKADVTKQIFTLSIQHGIKPANASYAYSVSTIAAQPESRIKILSNTKALQAAQIDDDTVAAIFWSLGTLEAGGRKLRVDKPCAILLSLTPKIHLTLADPTQSLTKIHAAFDDRTATITLPTAENAGSSVTTEFP